MSREAVNRVLELAPSRGLSHLEFRVLVYLADRLNKTTGRLDPSPECIARDCGMPNPETAERNIRRVIDNLVAMGLVERIGSETGGRGPGGRYPRRGYRLRLDGAPRVAAAARPRVVMMTGQGGPHDPPKGGPHDPRTKEVDLEPGKGNLPTGSTSRVEPDGSTAAAHSFSRMRPFLDDVLAYDEHAEWVDDQGIRLGTGKLLRTVQAARKFLAFCDNGEPGSWQPTTAAEYDALEALDVEPAPPSKTGPERESGPRTDVRPQGVRRPTLPPPQRPLSAAQSPIGDTPANEAEEAHRAAELARLERLMAERPEFAEVAS